MRLLNILISWFKPRPASISRSFLFMSSHPAAPQFQRKSEILVEHWATAVIVGPFDIALKAWLLDFLGEAMAADMSRS
jgi:hypothetical protein